MMRSADDPPEDEGGDDDYEDPADEATESETIKTGPPNPPGSDEEE
jgi:hypothetical protein